jgi:hypothetical protein
MKKTIEHEPPVEIYILTSASGEYEDYHVTIVGATTFKDEADAWVVAGQFDKGVTHDYEIQTLNKLDDHVASWIKQWKDPKINPLCECGHYLLHHRGGKKRSCKHNSKYQHNRHECKEFRLANPQPTT